MAVRIIHCWWYVDIRHMGTRYRKRCPSNNQSDAARYERLLRSELARHGSLDHMCFPRASRTLLLEELVRRWLREYVKVHNRPCVFAANSTILCNRLLPVLGNKPINEIGIQDIDKLKVHFVNLGLAAKTVNNYLCVLHRCLRSAVDWGLLDRIPRIQMLKTLAPAFRFLEPEDARRLVAAASPGFWRAMIVVALQTGLRASELQGLEWQDVDLGRRVLQVRRGVVQGHVAAPKSNRMRFVGLSDGVVAELAALPRDHARVFPLYGRGDGYNLMRNELHRASTAAGLSGKIGWHTLRHSFASHLVSAGAHLKMVQEALGHSSYEMTLRYAHLSPGAVQQTIQMLPNLSTQDKQVLATEGVG